jgi:putative heme iron utilization protein
LNCAIQRFRKLVKIAQVFHGMADSMAEIIEHMNADHKSTLVLLAREFARVESQEATMTAVDHPGFHARLKSPDGMSGSRIALSREVSNSAGTRTVLVKIVRHARER